MGWRTALQITSAFLREYDRAIRRQDKARQRAERALAIKKAYADAQEVVQHYGWLHETHSDSSCFQHYSNPGLA
jgi:hypothetical protein